MKERECRKPSSKKGGQISVIRLYYALTARKFIIFVKNQRSRRRIPTPAPALNQAWNNSCEKWLIHLVGLSLKGGTDNYLNYKSTVYQTSIQNHKRGICCTVCSKLELESPLSVYRHMKLYGTYCIPYGNFCPQTEIKLIIPELTY